MKHLVEGLHPKNANFREMNEHKGPIICVRTPLSKQLEASWSKETEHLLFFCVFINLLFRQCYSNFWENVSTTSMSDINKQQCRQFTGGRFIPKKIIYWLNGTSLRTRASLVEKWYSWSALLRSEFNFTSAFCGYTVCVWYMQQPADVETKYHRKLL